LKSRNPKADGALNSRVVGDMLQDAP
jgi:hypothetical protein